MTEKPSTAKYTPKYAAEFRERGVRLFREQRPNYPSDNAAYVAIASKLGCSGDTLRAWCVQAARDAGERNGLTTADRERMKQLVLKKASAYFALAERANVPGTRSANNCVH